MDANETEIYYAVLITGLLLGGIILYFAFAIMRYQRRRLDLQRGYFLNEIALLEKDRTRIAHDLHDDVGPLLVLTQFHIRHFIEGATSETHNLQDADNNIQQVLERLGEIAANLTPKALYVKGLYFALKDFTEQLQASGKLKVVFEFGINDHVPSNIDVHIYRIVQELLHNAVKHAEAQTVTVRIKQREKKLLLFYCDDGRGFSIEKANRKAAGIGLRSLRSRITMAGGKMHYYSAPGKGTEYLFEIPLIAKNE